MPQLCWGTMCLSSLGTHICGLTTSSSLTAIFSLFLFTPTHPFPFHLKGLAVLGIVSCVLTWPHASCTSPQLVLLKSGSEPEQTWFKLQTGPEVQFRFSNSTEPNRRSGLWFWPLWNCRTVFECGSNCRNHVLFHILSLSFKSLAGQVYSTCKQIQNKKSLVGQVHWTCKQIQNKKSIAGQVCWTCKQIWESQLWFDPHNYLHSQLLPRNPPCNNAHNINRCGCCSCEVKSQRASSFTSEPVGTVHSGYSSGLGNVLNRTAGSVSSFTRKYKNWTKLDFGNTTHSTEGSDSLFATFHILAITATTEPNITNNFWHFLLPQEQLPSGMLVIVYLYLFWLACQHMQTRVLAQTNEILVTRNTCRKDFSVPYQ